jgi:NADPH-dependent ferric siderophore reductase
MRHYTLAEVDPAVRSATLILNTRGDGPGRKWARALTTGQPLQLLGGLWI